MPVWPSFREQAISRTWSNLTGSMRSSVLLFRLPRGNLANRAIKTALFLTHPTPARHDTLFYE